MATLRHLHLVSTLVGVQALAATWIRAKETSQLSLLPPLVFVCNLHRLCRLSTRRSQIVVVNLGECSPMVQAMVSKVFKDWLPTLASVELLRFVIPATAVPF
jgi:hypothetical protein